MSEIEIAITIYVIFMVVTTFISIKYGSIMIRKTGLFLSNVLIAGTINLVLGILAIIGWYLMSWGVNEFLFFGGIVLGIGLLVISEAVLITTLFLKRKTWIQIYNETFN